MAEIIAKRYGRALFDLAEEKACRETLGEQAAVLRQLWQDTPELREFMARPEVSKESKKDLWEKVLKGQMAEELVNLLYLLTDKSRLAYLPEIIEVYEKLCMDQEKKVTAHVKSATALTEAQQKKLQETLSRRLDKTVTLAVEVDESLLGGLVVRVEDSLFDSSVKSRIERMTCELKKKNLKDEALWKGDNNELTT